ncbi:MAG: valine--tRNA ligase, partial [Candidatus Goldbacteria bacterium]|nr:valine--tRNA ligase [Candidatus Goldiibacteriota bacterium]
MLEKYEPQKLEPEIYKKWEERGYFIADNKSEKPSFCIVIPPPNVTGSLHMGHALNNTLQDILSRYKRLRGYNVLWLPGCDHAGIATQNVVERELKKEGKSRKDLGREKFLERVWQWKEKYGKTIMMQLRKLGSSLDWTRERFTMDEGLSEAVKEVFIRLYNEGLIYRGDYIINWCPRCLTALSDIEVIHKELDGFFYYIKYPFAENPEKFIEVATTRPETMLGDTAVAVNPDDERYKDLKDGTLFILPETGRKIPLIRDKYVDKTFGTGAVKITPGHDPNDFEIGLRHKLEIIKVMTEDGKMNENAGENGKYRGLDRFKARQQIVEELKSKGLLTKIEPHRHAVGHCYRCDTVVEPYVSTQWFVKVKPLAQAAIEIVEKDGVKFIPDMWKKIYFDWMFNIKDWCISRQLWWGHRIPAYYCSCGEIIVAKDAPLRCNKCGGSNIKQDEDVLDTWFSSALWPFSTLGWPKETDDLKKFYPTSVLVTSWDILFFWVARMIMMGMKFMGKQPFYHVVINSLVCDERGKKMSKSKGNVIDPLDILDKYSADALRFTMASLETQTRHISFSEDRLKGYHNFMNKIWNASKFVINNCMDYKEIKLTEQKLKIFEKWILNELDILKEKLTYDMENYKFSDAALSIYDFFWHTF